LSPQLLGLGCSQTLLDAVAMNLQLMAPAVFAAITLKCFFVATGSP
jgi:hypothetical protein